MFSLSGSRAKLRVQTTDREPDNEVILPALLARVDRLDLLTREALPKCYQANIIVKK